MVRTSDQIFEAYFDQLGSQFGLSVRERIHWICENISGKTVLDVGCSQGIAPLILAREGSQVLGIDIDKDVIDFAQDRLEAESNVVQKRVEFLCEDFVNYDFGSRKFDSVVLGEVLEHLSRPEECIKKILSVLDIGGKIVITVPFGVNDFFDHKRTYYFSGIYGLLVDHFSIQDVHYFGKWIGFVAERAKSPSTAGKQIDLAIVGDIEEAFLRLERGYQEETRRLKEQNGQINQFAEEWRDERFQYKLLKTTHDETVKKLAASRAEANNASDKHKSAQAELSETTQILNATKIELNETKRTLNSTKKEQSETASSLISIRQNYDALRESFSYKLGYDFVHAVIKPGKNTILFPLKTIKNLLRSSGRFQAWVEGRKKVLSDPDLSSSAQDTGSFSRSSNINVACIFDPFTIEGYRYEFNLIQTPVSGWRDVFARTKPDMFFVESAWRGNGGQWEYKVGRYAGQDGSELREILQWCQKNEVPTVFWNKEDPVNYDKFIDAARQFDLIFTTDVNMVPKYREASGHQNVYPLMFSAQPELHNPIRSTRRVEKVCFSGTYYRNVYEERRRDMDQILDIAQTYGLVIYDRNHERNLAAESEFTFPERFQKDILGSLDYAEMDKAYKGYKFTLNVNSIKQSPTMFSRRVFESLASGTPVLSTWSEGIDQTFGSLVLMSGKNIDESKRLHKLNASDYEYEKRSIAGVREIYANHLYQHRAQEILARAGVEVGDEGPASVTMIVMAVTSREVELAIAMFEDQAYDNRRLLIFLDSQAESAAAEFINKYSASNISIFHFYSATTLGYELKNVVDSNFIAFIELAHYYGCDYLTDLMHASIYTQAQVIGKSARFQQCSEEISVCEGVEYEKSDRLRTTSAIIRDDMFGMISLSDLSSITGNQLVSELLSHESYLGFSCNKYNFIERSLDFSAEISHHHKIYVTI
jgi:spore maturation protein CgeB/SAM-dependent methyltransferase